MIYMFMILSDCFLFIQFPDPKKMQINLTGFLNGKNARLFMTDLWDLLLNAQDSATGIPEQMIELKKEEIKKRMVIASTFQHIVLSVTFLLISSYYCLSTGRARAGSRYC